MRSEGTLSTISTLGAELPEITLGTGDGLHFLEGIR
ncbi:MAG: hypothetical protein JWP01_26 [Myxococcales bacterium]|nr:hypothetical protein [Myxococcales bacterium]